LTVDPFERYPKPSIHLPVVSFEETMVRTEERLHPDKRDIEQREQKETKAFECTIAKDGKK
jgi:hypothetical protein